MQVSQVFCGNYAPMKIRMTWILDHYAQCAQDFSRLQNAGARKTTTRERRKTETQIRTDTPAKNQIEERSKIDSSKKELVTGKND